MYKTTKRKARRIKNEYDILADLEKIKNAFGDTARDVGGRANQMLADSLENARETTVNLQEGVVGYVNEKPIKALGIAMVAGAAIAFLFYRKML